MKRTLGGIAVLALVLSGCGAIDAAKDVKDAAKGIANAGKDAEEFQARYERSKTLTYTATYTVKKPNSPDETFTIVQKPPKSAYKQADSEFIDDGTKLYTCTKDSSSGKFTCIETGTHTEAGLFGAAGFGFAFNPASFVGVYMAAAFLPGVNASKSSRSYGGLDSACTKIDITSGTDAGNSFEGCTSNDGIFTYSLTKDKSGTTEVTLTNYDRSVADSAFTLPAKAQTTDDLLRDATSTTAERSTTSTTEETTTTSSEDTTTTP